MRGRSRVHIITQFLYIEGARTVQGDALIHESALNEIVRYGAPTVIEKRNLETLWDHSASFFVSCARSVVRAKQNVGKR